MRAKRVGAIQDYFYVLNVDSLVLYMNDLVKMHRIYSVRSVCENWLTAFRKHIYQKLE